MSQWVYKPKEVEKGKARKVGAGKKFKSKDGPQFVKFKQPKPLSSVSSSQSRPRFNGGPLADEPIEDLPAEQYQKLRQELSILNI